MQKWQNSIANAMELCHYCIKPWFVVCALCKRGSSHCGINHWNRSWSCPGTTPWCCYDREIPGPRFNIKISFYQYRKSHCGDKTVVRSSYLHNGISYTSKMASLYWFSLQLINLQLLPNISSMMADIACPRMAFYLWRWTSVHGTQSATGTWRYNKKIEQNLRPGTTVPQCNCFFIGLKH